MPWTPSRVRLPVETRSIHIRQDGAWKGIGGVIIEMLVSMVHDELIYMYDCTRTCTCTGWPRKKIERHTSHSMWMQ